MNTPAIMDMENEMEADSVGDQTFGIEKMLDNQAINWQLPFENMDKSSEDECVVSSDSNCVRQIYFGSNKECVRLFVESVRFVYKSVRISTS